ncbi:type II toxin-antitoxin system PemK/MazF family toxin [Sulfurimonas sp. MAG313]|nr:type II toxin-antitoxin system PemK/MazF family toxin [Sulfurimonas sp. MAG313]MDF1881425.1 type II toxin-antitoxin system PemK/MazF family toxin [Sulfurimonas sp. MAG313]
MVNSYTPKKGDIIILTFDPQAGHEQAGRRPVLTLSDELFNENVGLAIACPITNTDRNFPFHIPVAKLITILDYFYFFIYCFFSKSLRI